MSLNETCSTDSSLMRVSAVKLRYRRPLPVGYEPVTGKMDPWAVNIRGGNGKKNEMSGNHTRSSHYRINHYSSVWRRTTGPLNPSSKKIPSVHANITQFTTLWKKERELI